LTCLRADTHRQERCLAEGCRQCRGGDLGRESNKWALSLLFLPIIFPEEKAINGRCPYYFSGRESNKWALSLLFFPIIFPIIFPFKL